MSSGTATATWWALVDAKLKFPILLCEATYAVNDRVVQEVKDWSRKARTCWVLLAGDHISFPLAALC